MEEKRLKEEMQSLWKETFGDSVEYISLVFDNYFHVGNVAYMEIEGKVCSALLGVPYNFRSPTGVKLKGLYLCGLATRKENRRRGLMSGLLEEINSRARKEGFDFTFLVPEGEGVRRYYRDRGYIDAFYKKIEYYVRGHKFGDDSSHTLSLSLFNKSEIAEAVEFLTANGSRPFKRRNAFNIVHSRSDWEIVLREAEISSEPVYLARRDGVPAGLAFCKTSDRSIEVKNLIVSDKKIYWDVLSKINMFNPSLNLTLIRDLEEVVESESNESQIWQPFYAQSNSPKAQYEDIAEIEEPYNQSRDAVSFGMINIFDIKEILEKLGCSELEKLNEYSLDEKKHLLLRRPIGKQGDELEKLLDLPELSLSASLLLE